MENNKYIEYILEQTKAVLAIDSPSGYTKEAVEYVCQAYRELGYKPQVTVKGGVLVELGPADCKDAILVEAHLDTLGAMVAEIKADGRLKLSPLGGLNPNNAEAEPRTRITENGYIKSRFLDDKLSVGILLGFAKWMKEENITPSRKIYHHLTVYEEVGHGACGTVPTDVTEILCVDMGCVGEGLTCNERQVSICAKDSAGPYTYEVVGALIEAAKRACVDYIVDVYPHYSSDADAALRADYDVRHGLIGAGVYASHGYERSHVNGVKNTFALLQEYLK